MGCGPPWTIVVQATPNPLLSQASFVEEPVELTGLGVGESTEKVYLEGKDGETRASWQVAKKALAKSFDEALASAAKARGLTITPKSGKPAGFTIAPAVRWIEPGFKGQTAAAPSRVKMVIQIKGANGAVLDQIEIQHGTPANSTHETIESRLVADGASLGELCADYLKSRATPGP
jgi:hypothetical protein